MVQAADVRDLDDRAAGRRLDRPRKGRILVQREVSAPLVIVGEVLLEVAAQRPLVPRIRVLIRAAKIEIPAKIRVLGAPQVYNGAIRDRQNGNLGLEES